MDVSLTSLKPNTRIMPADTSVSRSASTSVTSTGSSAASGAPTAPELKNVVYRSSDGDTLQVNPQAEEDKKRKEGRITEREDSARAKRLREERRMAEERRRQAIKEEAAAIEAKKRDAEEQNSASFVGKSVSDIERMYQQGLISRSVYEKQKAIKEEANKASSESIADFSDKSAKLNGIKSRAELDSQAIKGAYGNNSNSGPISAKERMAAMDRVNNTINNSKQATISEGKRAWEFQLQA